MKKTSCFQKLIAAFLVFCLSFEQGAFAAPSLPGSMLPVQEISHELNFFSELPGDMAYVEEIWRPANETKENAPKLFLIQDAHAHQEAQTHIEETLKYLEKHISFDVLFFEGGFGRLNPELLRFFENDQTNIEMAEALLKKGEIGGPELYVLKENSDTLKLWGVEDAKIYIENIQAYREVLNQKNHIHEWLEQTYRLLDKEASTRLSAELYQFIKLWLSYENENIDFTAYLSALSDSSKKRLDIDLSDAYSQFDWPMLVRLFEIKNREAHLDLNLVEVEKAKLLIWIQETMPESKMLTHLNSQDEAPVKLRQKWEMFHHEAQQRGFKYQDYPEFFKAEGLKILEEEIDAIELFEEINKIRIKIIHSFGNEKDDQMIEKFNTLLRMKKLLNLELSFNEYETYQKQDGLSLIDSTAVEQAIQNADQFYETALKRDLIMTQKIREAFEKNDINRGVLIAGGFHTIGLTSLLRQQGISYVVLRPHLSDVSEDQTYEETMFDQKDPWGLFASTVRWANFLVTPEAWKEQGFSLVRRTGFILEILNHGLSQGEKINPTFPMTQIGLSRKQQEKFRPTLNRSELRAFDQDEVEMYLLEMLVNNDEKALVKEGQVFHQNRLGQAFHGNTEEGFTALADAVSKHYADVYVLPYALIGDWAHFSYGGDGGLYLSVELLRQANPKAVADFIRHPENGMDVLLRTFPDEGLESDYDISDWLSWKDGGKISAASSGTTASADAPGDSKGDDASSEEASVVEGTVASTGATADKQTNTTSSVATATTGDKSNDIEGAAPQTTSAVAAVTASTNGDEAGLGEVAEVAPKIERVKLTPEELKTKFSDLFKRAMQGRLLHGVVAFRESLENSKMDQLFYDASDSNVAVPSFIPHQYGKDRFFPMIPDPQSMVDEEVRKQRRYQLSLEQIENIAKASGDAEKLKQELNRYDSVSDLEGLQVWAKSVAKDADVLLKARDKEDKTTKQRLQKLRAGSSEAAQARKLAVDLLVKQFSQIAEYQRVVWQALQSFDVNKLEGDIIPANHVKKFLESLLPLVEDWPRALTPIRYYLEIYPDGSDTSLAEIKAFIADESRILEDPKFLADLAKVDSQALSEIYYDGWRLAISNEMEKIIAKIQTATDFDQTKSLSESLKDVSARLIKLYREEQITLHIQANAKLLPENTIVSKEPMTSLGFITFDEENQNADFFEGGGGAYGISQMRARYSSQQVITRMKEDIVKPKRVVLLYTSLTGYPNSSQILGFHEDQKILRDASAEKIEVLLGTVQADGSLRVFEMNEPNYSEQAWLTDFNELLGSEGRFKAMMAIVTQSVFSQVEEVVNGPKEEVKTLKSEFVASLGIASDPLAAIAGTAMSSPPLMRAGEALGRAALKIVTSRGNADKKTDKGSTGSEEGAKPEVDPLDDVFQDLIGGGKTEKQKKKEEKRRQREAEEAAELAKKKAAAAKKAQPKGKANKGSGGKVPVGAAPNQKEINRKKVDQLRALTKSFNQIISNSLLSAYPDHPPVEILDTVFDQMALGFIETFAKSSDPQYIAKQLRTILFEATLRVGEHLGRYRIRKDYAEVVIDGYTATPKPEVEMDLADKSSADSPLRRQLLSAKRKINQGKPLSNTLLITSQKFILDVSDMPNTSFFIGSISTAEDMLMPLMPDPRGLGIEGAQATTIQSPIDIKAVDEIYHKRNPRIKEMKANVTRLREMGERFLDDAEHWKSAIEELQEILSVQQAVVEQVNEGLGPLERLAAIQANDPKVKDITSAVKTYIERGFEFQASFNQAKLDIANLKPDELVPAESVNKILNTFKDFEGTWPLVDQRVAFLKKHLTQTTHLISAEDFKRHIIEIGYTVFDASMLQLTQKADLYSLQKTFYDAVRKAWSEMLQDFRRQLEEADDVKAVINVWSRLIVATQHIELWMKQDTLTQHFKSKAHAPIEKETYSMDGKALGVLFMGKENRFIEGGGSGSIDSNLSSRFAPHHLDHWFRPKEDQGIVLFYSSSTGMPNRVQVMQFLLDARLIQARYGSEVMIYMGNVSDENEVRVYQPKNFPGDYGLWNTFDENIHRLPDYAEFKINTFENLVSNLPKEKEKQLPAIQARLKKFENLFQGEVTKIIKDSRRAEEIMQRLKKKFQSELKEMSEMQLMNAPNPETFERNKRFLQLHYAPLILKMINFAAEHMMEDFVSEVFEAHAISDVTPKGWGDDILQKRWAWAELKSELVNEFKALEEGKAPANSVAMVYAGSSKRQIVMQVDTTDSPQIGFHKGMLKRKGDYYFYLPDPKAFVDPRIRALSRYEAELTDSDFQEVQKPSSHCWLFKRK